MIYSINLMYLVKYLCDETGDHRKQYPLLCDSDSRAFIKLENAINFHNECTEPLTSMNELIGIKVQKKSFTKQLTKTI